MVVELLFGLARRFDLSLRTPYYGSPANTVWMDGTSRAEDYELAKNPLQHYRERRTSRHSIVELGKGTRQAIHEEQPAQKVYRSAG